MTSQSLEARVAHVEGIVDEMRSRVDRLDEPLEALRREMAAQFNQVRDDIGQSRQETRANLLWSLGVMIPMWVTIIAAILLQG